ncbi:MAG: sigma-54 factor interaction domain-containing protein [Planctomycetes bacterium]|nr:sigma-54 factor interaction domain-containing protein [Planctomycetota bacterium]
MVGRSPPIVALREKVVKFARVPSPVLLRGESGTGKDLVARILVESELFGHVRGAFTGAIRDHDGHFVAAHGGTLFLDEIGDTPPAMQSKLLRALQEGEVRPVGSEKIKKVDVRVIAATNRDLEQLVGQGRFRQDLFYRLNVLQLWLPPLRERGDDVVLLARRLLAAAAAKAGRALRYAPAAEAALARARWPGNVRQLQNEVQRLAALAAGPEVAVEDLSVELRALV